jgi:hypothetical protein
VETSVYVCGSGVETSVYVCGSGVETSVYVCGSLIVLYSYRRIAGPSGRAVYGCSLIAIVGSNSTGGRDVFLLCVLSGRGRCDDLITRPEESTDCGGRIVVCDHETS